MKYSSLNIGNLKYDQIIGTGGIGTGIFFELIENETLGRNESRLGILESYKDYCKLHIILHYVSVLLGAHKPTSSFKVYPIGKVGNDMNGGQLIDEMSDVGMKVGNIGISDQSKTLFSVCFQYPDSTGGNITTLNSASNEVSIKDIYHFFKNHKEDSQREVILAVPEVPVSSRTKLLEIGRERGSYNISSVLCAEIKEFEECGGFENTDLLAINIDEARAITGIQDDLVPSSNIVEQCIEKLMNFNNNISLIITDGPNGSYGYHANNLEFIPSLKSNVVSTAGAGDTFLSGVISGICCGLPLLKGKNDRFFGETPLSSAMELGTLLASFAVTSKDTIDKTIDAKSLYQYAKEKSVKLSNKLSDLLLITSGHLNLIE